MAVTHGPSDAARALAMREKACRVPSFLLAVVGVRSSSTALDVMQIAIHERWSARSRLCAELASIRGPCDFAGSDHSGEPVSTSHSSPQWHDNFC
jgi:hypothetical protein